MKHTDHGSKPTDKDKKFDSRNMPMCLINEIGRLMGDKIREKGEANPISQRSGRLLLMELARKDGRTQLELVHATHLKAPTISVALQKMESDGIVRRTPDEFDLRATRVFLTDKGRELDNKIRKRIGEEEALATRNLTAEESDTLVRLLTKIKMNLVDEKKEGSWI